MSTFLKFPIGLIWSADQTEKSLCGEWYEPSQLVVVESPPENQARAAHTHT